MNNYFENLYQLLLKKNKCILNEILTKENDFTLSKKIAKHISLISIFLLITIRPEGLSIEDFLLDPKTFIFTGTFYFIFILTYIFFPLMLSKNIICLIISKFKLTNLEYVELNNIITYLLIFPLISSYVAIFFLAIETYIFSYISEISIFIMLCSGIIFFILFFRTVYLFFNKNTKYKLIKSFIFIIVILFSLCIFLLCTTLIILVISK